MNITIADINPGTGNTAEGALALALRSPELEFKLSTNQGGRTVLFNVEALADVRRTKAKSISDERFNLLLAGCIHNMLLSEEVLKLEDKNPVYNQNRDTARIYEARSIAMTMITKLDNLDTVVTTLNAAPDIPGTGQQSSSFNPQPQPAG